MPHRQDLKTFNVDRLRAHEVVGANSIYAPGISGDLVAAKTGEFEELYVAGVKHIPKTNFIYAFRFGGPCTESNYYTAQAFDDKVYVSNPNLFASGDHMIIDCGASGEETRLVSGVSGDHPPAGIIQRDFVQLYDNLFFNHNTGIQVCNKFGTLSTGLTTGGCEETCYDAAHLYMEMGTGMEHLGGDMTWYATGYREHFVGYSGMDAHITGLDIYGLLTFIYPD
jgi:hypothetical protein